MKTLILFVFTIISSIAFGQLIDGTLVDEKRKLITVTDFKVIDMNEGVMYFTLAVNRKGEVTSATLSGEGTTITSTPTKIKVRNYLMKLKFEEGTYYPEFHHVRVKVTVAKA